MPLNIARKQLGVTVKEDVVATHVVPRLTDALPTAFAAESRPNDIWDTERPFVDHSGEIVLKYSDLGGAADIGKGPYWRCEIYAIAGKGVARKHRCASAENR